MPLTSETRHEAHVSAQESAAAMRQRIIAVLPRMKWQSGTAYEVAEAIIRKDHPLMSADEVRERALRLVLSVRPRLTDLMQAGILWAMEKRADGIARGKTVAFALLGAEKYSRIPAECSDCDMQEHCTKTCPTCGGESPEWPTSGEGGRSCRTCHGAGRLFDECQSSDCAVAAADAKATNEDLSFETYREQQAGLF